MAGDTNENSVRYSMGDTGFFSSIGQQEGITINNITVVTVTLAGSSSSRASVDEPYFSLSELYIK